MKLFNHEKFSQYKKQSKFLQFEEQGNYAS